MTTYLKFINPFRRYRGKLIATGICSLGYVLFNALSLWLVAPVLKLLFMPGTSTSVTPEVPGLGGWYESLKAWFWSWFQGATPSETLPKLCILLIAVFLVKNVFAYGQMHFVSYVEQRMVKDLRDHVFGHLAKLPYSFFDKRATGDVMSSVMNDVYVLSLTFQRVFTQALRDPLTVIVLLVILISISWELTLTAIVIVPLFGFVYRLTGKSLKRKSSRIQAKLGEITSYLQEAISGARVIKQFGTERFESRRFEERSGELFHHSLRLARLDRMAQPLSETIGVAIISMVLLFGGQRVLAGELLDAEDFIRFIVVLFSILTPIRSIGGIFNNMQVGSAAGARVETLLNEPTESLQSGDDVPAGIQKEIRFDHVWFKYESSADWVLRDVNLVIRKNEKIALIGRSGSGKTTLANLIPRFYDIQQGTISIDGQPLRDIQLGSLRKLVSVVSQDVFLFNESVRYNISYGMEHPDEQKLRDVIQRAQATDFVSALPNGLDTVVGERGTQLSGGQRQRLAIARALLRDSPILIFDEATSALDSESERLIQRALEELFRNRTVILIAHRLSSIRVADRVVVLDRGAVASVGTHEELLASAPIYRSLMAVYETEPVIG